ncbi:MAG: hypothetical protein M0Q38_08420 [Bacteroidales bacterium]|jgi:polyhydroxybutyrate depolymerase|nr:hypothetical protein [Bacteroidales bacterium]
MRHLPVLLIILAFFISGCNKAPEEEAGNYEVTPGGYDSTIIQVTPGLYDSTIIVDGLTRSFCYYIPTDFSFENHSSLTMVLHGMTQTGPDILGTIFSSVGSDVDKTNSIIVFPTALFGHWNDRMGGVFPSTDTINDVKFLTSLIDYFISGFNCNPDRIYFMGFSNGGMMTYRMSCEIPEKIRAIAPFISMMGEAASKQTTQSPPVPVFITNGTVDPIMLWNGGVVGTSTVPLLGVLLSNEENVTYWVNRNHANQIPDTTFIPDYFSGDSSTVVSYHYSGVNEVVFNKVINGGHFVPVLRDTIIVPTFNCDFESVKAAWVFLHNH